MTKEWNIVTSNKKTKRNLTIRNKTTSNNELHFDSPDPGPNVALNKSGKISSMRSLNRFKSVVKKIINKPAVI